MTLRDCGRFIDHNDRHPAKAKSSISMIDDGNNIEYNFLQLRKDDREMTWREGDMEIDSIL